jgi:hypothetical protein
MRGDMGGDMRGNGRYLSLERHRQPAGRGRKNRIRPPSQGVRYIVQYGHVHNPAERGV